MQWVPSLSSLCKEGRRLSDRVQPYTCDQFKVLLSVTDDEGVEFDRGDLTLSDLASRVALRTGLSNHQIVATFEGDLRDYSEFYGRALRSYQVGGKTDSEYKGILQSSRDILTVYHASLYSWCPDNESFGMLLLRETDPTKPFVEATLGYLVAQKRAYPTGVHLLEDAYEQKWDKWEVLYERYF